MSDRAPAFQFYPKDWLADSNVKAMSVEAKGAYIELLCVYWLENGLPASPDRLARLIGLPGAKFRRLWPQVAPCFSVDGDRLRQKRMDRERAKQDAFRDKKSAAGLEGAKSKWINKPKMAQPQIENGTPTVLPMANDSSSVSVLPSAVSVLRTPVERTADGPCKHPLVLGRIRPGKTIVCPDCGEEFTGPTSDAGPKRNPFVAGKRDDFEREALSLCWDIGQARLARERSGGTLAADESTDGAEIFAKAAHYEGALRQKVNPANLTDDRLLNTVIDLRDTLRAEHEKRSKVSA